MLDRTKTSKRTEQSVEQSLYEKRQKIYPREVHGIYALLRSSIGFVLLGIFYVTPWVHWNGQQAILLDLPARKFHILGITFWPQDFLLLAFLLILAAMSLFLFTALAGRLWCGYACPQTVWTDVFLWFERRIEGDRMSQMRLDKAPFGWRKFRLKATKHAVWLTFAAFTGFTFVAYFTPAYELAAAAFTLSVGPWETFWMGFYGFATYGNAGWMREQVCKYMCPYARFQSAMFDENTLIVSYDEDRGEQRGGRKYGSDYQGKGLGDCIDCTMCVQVCPTGIDIRNGLQYECIGCAACIDVCNDVMAKMDYPSGLIRYTTENAIHGRPTHLLRPRVIVYATILLVLTAAFLFLIGTRVPIGLDVIRDRNQLYREVDGRIENVYTLRLINKDGQAHHYRLSAAGIENLALILDTDDVHIAEGSVVSIAVRLRADEEELPTQSNDVTFTLAARDREGLTITTAAKFLGPLP